jgi:2-polyprenyl-3-methyl-5-hydroxy-6-metoxy-1,4-benzoquinol methylase
VATPEALSSTAIRGSLAIAPVGTRGTEVSPQEEILWALEEKAPRYNEWLLSRALPHLGGHVLEIGAGIGTFSLLLATHGIRVSALEPDEELADVLEERASDLAGIDVLRGDIEGFAVDRPAEPFDSVICFNVLEHIPDDRAALKTMAGCLKEGGQLMLLAPAHRFLFGETDRTVDHQRRYHTSGVSRLLTDVGLEVVQLKYVNPIGAAGWFVSSRLLRRRKLSKSSLKIYEQLVPTLRTFDRLRFPVGLSVWARARLGVSPR